MAMDAMLCDAAAGMIATPDRTFLSCSTALQASSYCRLNLRVCLRVVCWCRARCVRHLTSGACHACRARPSRTPRLCSAWRTTWQPRCCTCTARALCKWSVGFPLLMHRWCGGRTSAKAARPKPYLVARQLQAISKIHPPTCMTT